MRLLPVAVLMFLLNTPARSFDTTFAAANRFLKSHVCDGGVDYSAAGSDQLLDTVLNEFAELTETKFASFSRDVRLASLINLYNIATIKLVTDKRPESSIRDIPDAWKRKWIRFLGKKVSLDEIEHQFIRKKFKEPRIHFALVCAAASCPVLRSGAYTPDDLNSQLESAAMEFLTDSTRNSVGKKLLSLSKIFEWYGDDFNERYGGFEAFVKQTVGITGAYRVVFKPYDWSLNKAECP